MEIKDMKIEDIEKRMAEIEAEKEAPDANIDALTEEVRSMNERKQELIKAAEERQATLDAIVEGNVETDVKETFEEERKTMTNVEVRKSAEYIDAFANYIKSNDDAECRSLLTENVSGSDRKSVV